MKKNGFFTFCFAFIPGAGQMYQGYMKRGLSLICICCVFIVLTMMLEPMMFFAAVVWMYSFFDTFNLRSQLLTGTAPADDYLVHLGHDETLTRLLSRRHKLFGWGLIVLGIYALYDNLLMEFLSDLYWNSKGSWIIRAVYNIMDRVPETLFCLALIALGVWLVRGPKQAGGAPNAQIGEYKEYNAKEDGGDDGEEN